MHGSPMCPYDSRDLWKNYNYKDFGIIGEPYFDIDFSKVLYLTDTGRSWDGEKVSVRDKVIENGKLKVESENLLECQVIAPFKGVGVNKGQKYRSTNDIIKAAIEGRLPNQILITTHPQRWTNNPFAWSKELVLQNVKNVVKGVLVKKLKVRK